MNVVILISICLSTLQSRLSASERRIVTLMETMPRFDQQLNESKEKALIKVLEVISKEDTEAIINACEYYYSTAVSDNAKEQVALKIYLLNRFAFDLPPKYIAPERWFTVTLLFRMDTPPESNVAWLSPFAFRGGKCKMIADFGGYLQSRRSDPLSELRFLSKQIRRRSSLVK